MTVVGAVFALIVCAYTEVLLMLLLAARDGAGTGDLAPSIAVLTAADR